MGTTASFDSCDTDFVTFNCQTLGRRVRTPTQVGNSELEVVPTKTGSCIDGVYPEKKRNSCFDNGVFFTADPDYSFVAWVGFLRKYPHKILSGIIL